MKEQEAFNLAKIYLNFYKTHTNKHFHLGSVKKTKWWRFFLQTIEKYSDKKIWDPYVFMWAQFEKYEKIFPSQLPTEAAWKVFIEYRHRMKPSQKEETLLAKNLLNTYNMVKRWSLEHGCEAINFDKFINNDYNKMMIDRKTYDLSLFTIVDSAQEIVKEVLTEDEVIKKRALIFNNKKILHKIKKVLGKEFV